MKLDERLPDARLHPVGPDKVTRSCSRELFTANTIAAPQAGRAAAAEAFVTGLRVVQPWVWRAISGVFPDGCRNRPLTWRKYG